MRFAVLLFILLLVSCFFAAFMPQEAADVLVYGSLWFKSLLGLLFASTLFCIVRRLAAANRHQSLKGTAASLLFHCGACVIVLGAFCTLLFTQNGLLHLHEGESAKTAQDDGGEFTLPFTIELERFDVAYDNTIRRYIIVKNSDGIEGAYQLAPEKNAFTMKTGKSQRFAKNLVYGEKKLSLTLDESVYMLEESLATDIGGDYSLLYVSQNIPEALSYASFLVFTDAQTKKHAHTDANNPAYFKGYAVYQSGYSEDGKAVSVLRVKHDWGKYITLAGSLLLCAGLFLRLVCGRIK